MKKKLLYMLLLTSGFASAQIVNIPDANLKARLTEGIEPPIPVAYDQAGNALDIDTDDDGEISYAEAALVYGINVSTSGISDLTGLEAFVNLKWIQCANNNLTTIDVAWFPGLTNLICSQNPITAIDLTDFTYLEGFEYQGTSLATLNLAGMTTLTRLQLSGAPITVLDMSGLTALVELTIEDVPISVIDLDDSVNLQNVNIFQTNIVNLDLSNASQMTHFACIMNLSLETINLKNGGEIVWAEDSIISNCPAITFICIDESEEGFMIQNFGEGNTPPFSTYCSFTPGGDYNTITGTMTFDADANGCDELDPLHYFMKMEINDGTTIGAAFTGASSNYTFYTGAGDFTVTPQFENDWFIATPASADVNFPDTNNNIATENFCITANGVHNDVEVVMVPVVGARPGFDAVYKVVYKNKGNQILNGSVTCGWDYTVLTGVDITPLPDAITPGVYTWNYTDLLPFENREILMTLHVNSPTDTPAVNAGDILPFTAEAVSGGVDDTPADNMFELNQVVINAFDPNNIICIQGESAATENIGEYLHYVVNFENTGNAAATFIVVESEIDAADFDISSLQVLNSSHEALVRVNGNRVEFIFNNINLAALDHGNILFKLKSLSTLEEGDSVVNKADIYFDYNHPVATNEVETVFETLSTGEFEIDNSVKVYPNPAESIISVEAKGVIQSISLYDIQGRVLQTKTMGDKQVTLDISSRQTGMYFLKVTTDEGVKVEKIIKK